MPEDRNAPLEKKKTMGKGENAGYQHFFFLPKYCSLFNILPHNPGINPFVNDKF